MMRSLGNILRLALAFAAVAACGGSEETDDYDREAESKSGKSTLRIGVFSEMDGECIAGATICIDGVAMSRKSICPADLENINGFVSFALASGNHYIKASSKTKVCNQMTNAYSISLDDSTMAFYKQIVIP